VEASPVVAARPAVAAAPSPAAPATSVPSRGGALPGVAIAIPGAIGELFDKITILEIKAERIADPLKLANVRNELSLLKALQASEGLRHPRLAELRANLKTVNASLWDVEDNIRLCEKKEDFGPDFIALARSVYRLNDERAALKLSINRLFNSAIVEEKSYA
jgi:hypothetical protein